MGMSLTSSSANKDHSSSFYKIMRWTKVALEGIGQTEEEVPPKLPLRLFNTHCKLVNSKSSAKDLLISGNVFSDLKFLIYSDHQRSK